MAGVKLQHLSKDFFLCGKTLHAVQDVSASIEHGSFTVIVGKSGCGKTTLLRLLSGLEEKTAGQILWTDCNGQPVSPKIGLVFQEPRLMPWLTVFENMAFSLSRSLSPVEKDAVVSPTLSLLGLSAFRNAYPAQLSGGMAQRVSLGRTLCFHPDVILMDEPFGALDYFTRKKLQREIVDLFLTQKKTLIFVTHDVTEALYLGEKILVMESGTVIREISVDMPYPRDSAAVAFLQTQQVLLECLGGI